MKDKSPETQKIVQVIKYQPEPDVETQTKV